MPNETNNKPHQDPIHQGLRRPADGLAAAQLDIDQLNERVAQVASRVQDLEDRYAAAQRVHDLDAQCIQALESQLRTVYTVLKANKIIPE